MNYSNYREVIALSKNRLACQLEAKKTLTEAEKDYIYDNIKGLRAEIKRVTNNGNSWADAGMRRKANKSLEQIKQEIKNLSLIVA